MRPRLPNRVQDISRSIEVDAVSLVEILFGFARDNRGQVKDHIGLVVNQSLDRVDRA